jgi:hypothetical protein
MIMGLINYPELGDSADKIEEELEYFSKFFIQNIYIYIYIIFF